MLASKKRLLPAAHVPCWIAQHTPYEPPNSRKVYTLVTSAIIPAVFVRGRWYVEEDKLPEIVEIWRRLAGFEPAKEPADFANSVIA